MKPASRTSTLLAATCGAIIGTILLTDTCRATGPDSIVNSPDEASLRAAICLGGWVSLQFNGTVTLTNTINITNHVILDGQIGAVTIDGGNAVQLFYVAPGASFSATNLTLANGSSIITNDLVATNADGGAIYNDGGCVTLVGCTLTNNSAQSLIIAGVARGGAIFNNAGTVALFQSSIVNSRVIGGGPNTSITGSLNSSTLTGLGLGGAIYNTNGELTIIGCTVNSNLCQSVVKQNYLNHGTGLAMGGAVFQSSGSMIVSNSGFRLNQVIGGNCPPNYPPALPSPAYGGALAVAGGTLCIARSQFGTNQAVAGAVPNGDTQAGGPGAEAGGGAVYCASEWTVEDSSFFNNSATGGVGDGGDFETGPGTAGNGCGGGIYNSGTGTLNRCSFYSNSGTGGAAQSHDLGNPSTGGDGLGGAIYSSTWLAMTNCTVAYNRANVGNGSPSYMGGDEGIKGGAFGAGVFNSSGTLSMMNVTCAVNLCTGLPGPGHPSARIGGFQVGNTNGTLSLHNTILMFSPPFLSFSATYGPVTDDGYNICDDNTAAFSSGSSHNNTDPKLDSSLANNGGPTLSIALLAGSPAIDAGDGADSPNTDQRGYFRTVGNGPDIGAYESASFPLVVPNLSLTGTVSNVLLSFTAAMPTMYRVQISSDLNTWTDLNTNGPFATPTNIIQTLNAQDIDHSFFRLLAQ